MTNTNPRDLIKRLADALTNAIRVIHNEDGTQHVSTAVPVLDEAYAYLSQSETGGRLMTEQKQITLEKALELVDFEFIEGAWRVKHVRCDVWGDVRWDVFGNVHGTINGRKWQFIETPREKLKRLIEEGADKAQLLEAINQLEGDN